MFFSTHFLAASPSFAFASESWAWTAIVLGIGGIVLLVISYRTTPLRGASKAFALALKAIGLVLLALALLEPVHLSEEPKKNANDLVVAVDDSAGLALAPADGSAPSELLRESVAAGADGVFPDWLEKAGDTFRLQTFAFDRTLRRSPDFQDLAFERSGSNIGTVLDDIDRRFANRPLAAIVMLTDGNPTDPEKWDEWLAAREKKSEEEGETVPVFPVVVGADYGEAADLAVLRVDAETTQFEDARVTLTVEVGARGTFAAPPEIFVVDAKGNELAAQAVAFPEEAGPRNATSRVRLAAIPPGISFLTVGIRQTGEAVPELTDRNDSQQVVVNAGTGPYRILYVSGRPNWEYKFLRRSLAEDAELDLVGLIRIAKREPKFEWRGRVGESSNPLFRGFDSDIPEETQRYDEPVLIRLNTATPEELRDGFPGSDEALFPAYRAIVFDDIEAEFLTLDQQERVERFVSRRGGTVVMLGGQESFRPGGWDNTPISRLLPVYLEAAPGDTPALEAVYDLTREGWLQPWMRLRADQEAETTRLAYMPPLFAINRISAVKPGASILATVTDSEERALPAVVTQRYGEGRAAAVTVGDFWRWGMKDEQQQAELARTWRQLMRWAVNDVPSRVMMEKEEIDAGGLPLTKLSVRVRDDAFEPQDDATVLLTVTDESGGTTQIPADPSLEEPGLFTAEHASETEGGFRIEATVVDGEGREIGTDETARTFNPDAREFARLGPDRERLSALAAATGGRMIELSDLADLPGLLAGLELPVSETRQTPLWHTPWLFALALACFLGEWILRRKQGIL